LVFNGKEIFKNAGRWKLTPGGGVEFTHIIVPPHYWGDPKGYPPAESYRAFLHLNAIYFNEDLGIFIHKPNSGYLLLFLLLGYFFILFHLLKRRKHASRRISEGVS
jgi:hypothetical protein